MGAQELSSLLWKERELLELLTFKLEEEQLILTSGNTRWLQHATREVEQVVDRLRMAGLGRTVEAAALAKEWGTEENASLSDIAVKAPAGPWSEIFAGHLKALAELITRIRELRDANDRFLRAAARSTQETVAGLGPDAGTYDSRGGTGLDAGARLFDKNL